MGANAARHTLEIVDNVRYILAIELLTAAQAIDLRTDGPAQLGHASRIAYEGVRRYVPFMDRDRESTPDIEKLAEVIRAEGILQMLETVLPS